MLMALNDVTAKLILCLVQNIHLEAVWECACQIWDQNRKKIGQIRTFTPNSVMLLSKIQGLEHDYGLKYM